MDNLSPPLPQHSSSGNSFPVLAIALIGILATALLLVGYYVFVIKCCLYWHRIDVLNRFSSRRRRNPNFNNGPSNFAISDGDVIAKGLDGAIIRSIPVIKFRKLPEQERENNNGGRKSETASSYECAVCLSEFEDGERLRVIPNCCHAFHIDCIDIWLQSNANCPLCRSGISPSSILYNDRIFLESSSSTQENCDNFSGNDDDYVVIEIEWNNLDEPRLVSSSSNREGGGERKKKKLEHVCSMGDEWIDMKREKDEEFRIVQPIRRSISMDFSAHREISLEMQQCSKQMREISSPHSSSKVRRSIFSFGYGRNSRGSVQPLHLDS